MTGRLQEAKARQIYLVLRDRIVSGALGFGARLPTENDLASTHGVSRVTVRRALGELESEHLIERRRSAGTRVVYRAHSSLMSADISGVLANLAEMGRRTSVRLLSFGYVPAAGPAAEALSSGDHELLQRSVRVRSVDGQPFSYLLTHVPERIGATFTRKELADRPLLELLERSGVKVERATQRISASLAAPDVARALSVKTGSPLIELVRTVFDHNGRGVEHLYALYRPDRYGFEFDLVRSGGASNRGWSPLPNVRRKPARKTRSSNRIALI
ncbi:MAG TPA: GntR family transcriptional regulator [Bradyrhizobium sp.]|uniref:GntR family transcriptional regulator n=1 Tax=Bradyrhizobium sp. TaxID=376 RepID=UPI002D7E83A9|nr:GntR family transcriptional regulator [Bradyrhizobium sp.]HET7884802.1 GntR family transcriptional regulator [Bradyrhizobium sp.]